MTIRYEANPPKIVSGVDVDESIRKFIIKIKSISQYCDMIHLTENVLGHQRVSPIKIGGLIKNEMPDLPITVSLRVRDKNESQIQEFVKTCIKEKFEGILILMGDPPQDGSPDSGMIPSQVANKLREEGINSKINLYLSIPNNPNFEKIGKKIAAKPAGFMTQVIQSVQQVEKIIKGLQDFSVIPIVLYPSEKNEQSAKFLNLDVASYKDNFESFVSKVHKITGDVLITSPSDYIGVSEFLKSYSTKYSASE